MKLSLLLFLSVCALLISCCRQSAFEVSGGNVISRKIPGTFGDTVSGLSDTILVIYQDKKNNYWFGSRGNGVYRYDGKNLIRFTMEDGLVSNDIWGIQEDRSGNIFFDTQEGVSKFDGQKFSTLGVDYSDSEWKLEPDDLWFKGNWNENGTYRYDGKSLHHLEFPENKRADQLYANSPNMNWSPYGIYSIYKDSRGNIWFGTSNLGIYRYNGKSVSLMFEDHLTNPPGGGSFGIRSILEDEAGRFWFCNTNYRYVIHPDDSVPANGQHLIRFTTEKGIDNVKDANGAESIYYLSITEDNNQNLWMVTFDEGIWKYDGRNMKHYSLKAGTKDLKLFSVYKDNHGDLWIGSQEAGAYRFNGKSFEKFRP